MFQAVIWSIIDFVENCQNRWASDVDCDYWASDGECEVNENWMADQCTKSCRYKLQRHQL